MRSLPVSVALFACAGLLALVLAWALDGSARHGAGGAVAGASAADQRAGAAAAGPSALALGASDAAVSGGAARAAEGEALEGHVESTVDGARLGGWRLGLWGPDGLQAEAVSAADGTFTLWPSPPLPLADRASVVRAVPPKAGDDAAAGDGVARAGEALKSAPAATEALVSEPEFEPVDPAQDVRRDAAGALVPIVILARPVRRGALKRTLVDEATGEPVPYFELQLVKEGWGVVAATSDGRGVLRTPVELPSGPGLGRLVDHPASVGAAHLAPVAVQFGPTTAGAPNLALRVGPTFRLAFESSEPVVAEDLSATVRRAGDDVDARAGGWTVPIRTEGDAGPWVRLRPFSLLFPFDQPEVDGPYLLEVQDAAQSIFASAALPAFAGVHEAPLVLRFQRVGAVRGRVLDQDGEPVGGAQVSLFDGSRDGVVYEAETTATGAFGFRSVGPGEHAVRVFSRRHGIEVRPVRLGPGESVELELRLAHGTVGRIGGIARTVTGGRVPSAVILRLRPHFGPRSGPRSGPQRSLEARDLVFHTGLDWDADAGLARFDFGELPAGRYELEVLAYAGPRWEPARLTFDAPNDSLELLCRNDEHELPLVATGAPAARYFRAAVGGEWVSEPLDGDRLVLPTTDLSSIDAWALLERGKRPARGAGWQLDRATDGPDLGAVLVAAPLEAGWGRVVFVTSGGAPVQGVSVRVDGTLAAVTGSDGGVLVEAAAPAIVTLDLPAHRIEAPDDDGFELRFRVERE